MTGAVGLVSTHLVTAAAFCEAGLCTDVTSLDARPADGIRAVCSAADAVHCMLSTRELHVDD